MKWLNTLRGERKESVDTAVEPFEKQVESTPISRNLGELLRSQTAQAEYVAKKLETLNTDHVSLIVEGNDYAFYMGNLAALSSEELPLEPCTAAKALKGPLRSKVERSNGHRDAHTDGTRHLGTH